MEMAYLKNFIETEYKKGNYVIAGGDWNQCPPDFRPEFRKHKMDNTLRKDISSEYMPDWKWAYDLSEPSNRRVTTPYNVETTLTTVIDFFLISPNIIIKSVGTKHLEFEHSDHNPVVLNIKLK
jgi:exonuclease III